MNRLKTLLFGAALVAASSALASAQPNDDRDRRDGRYEDRDHDRGRDRDRDRHYDRDRDRHDRDRDDRRFRDRDDHRYFRDRDDRRYFHDRDDVRFYYQNDYHYRIGERRYFDGYYWSWDGERWCRRNNGVLIYFRF